MSTLIGILTVIVFCFFIARKSKSHRTFVNLLLAVTVGFIVGASLKSKLFTNDDDNQPKVECTALDSISQNDSSAVVWTVEPDTFEMNSLENQETDAKRDTVQKPNGGDSTKLITPEIQNDS